MPAEPSPDKATTEPAKPDPFETLAEHLEGGVRVRDLGKLVRCFKAKTVWALLGVLAAVFSLGVGAGFIGYDWAHPRASEHAAPRVRPKELAVGTALSSEAAQKEQPWLSPTMDSLEREAADELKQGRWKSSTVVLFESKSLPQPSEEFKLRVKTPGGYQVSGYAFLAEGPGGAQTFRFLGKVLASARSDRAAVVSVPEAQGNALLLFAVRVSTDLELPTEAPQLLPLVSLSVE